MAKDERNANAAELTDVRTSGEGAAGANAPVRALGKVQQKDANNAANSLEGEALDTGDKNNKVIVNPALRGDVGIPFVDEDGNLGREDFAAGKVHFVDDETAALEINGVKLFVAADQDEEE